VDYSVSGQKTENSNSERKSDLHAAPIEQRTEDERVHRSGYEVSTHSVELLFISSEIEPIFQFSCRHPSSLSSAGVKHEPIKKCVKVYRLFVIITHHNHQTIFVGQIFCARFRL
jgi:hypothetical protein